MLASCASRQACLTPAGIAPSVLVPASQAGIVDGRGRFREIFEQVLSTQGGKLPSGAPCTADGTLWKLAGEPPGTGAPVSEGRMGETFRVVFVPGLLAECLADKPRAFSDAAARLKEIGCQTDYIQTAGRKRSAHNAALIRDAVMAMPGEERIIFVTHSKGTVDTLEALATYPAVGERTAALVSVSGAVNGSPLADEFPDFLVKLMHQMPLPSCPPGEGSEAVESLRRSVRIAWLASHPLPARVRYYSLAAFTSRENTSFILHPFYDILARTDPANDGMVFYSDAIVPGSVLLGYPNADHYAVAMPFSIKATPLLAGLIDKNDYPRSALVEAAVRFVEEDLAKRGPAAPGAQ